MQVVFLFQNNKMTIHNNLVLEIIQLLKKSSTSLKADNRLLLLSWNICLKYPKDLKLGTASFNRKFGYQNTAANCMPRYPDKSPKRAIYFFLYIYIFCGYLDSFLRKPSKISPSLPKHLKTCPDQNSRCFLSSYYYN